MRRIIEPNLLRNFKKIYSISDTYNSGLIFGKVSAIYSATQNERHGSTCARNTEPLYTKSLGSALRGS